MTSSRVNILIFSIQLSILYVFTPNTVVAQEFGVNLEDFVSKNRNDSDLYMFEKLGFHGDYVPTILVFGYPNNKGACGYILKYASEDNPKMQFRCRKIEKKL